MPPQTQQRVDPIIQNAQIRAALIATGIRCRKDLGVFTSGLGGSTRIKLFNVGITTGLKVRVTVPIAIGTAVAVPSAKAPYNIMNRVRLTDYDNTDRVNISGLQLFLMACIRNRTPFGYNNSPNIAGGIITNPSTPTAIGNGNLQFVLEIPLAYDAENSNPALQDLRGAILSQTAVGEMYLTIDWNASLYANGDIESVYSGAPTTTVALQGGQFINVQVWQDYILPQPLPGTNGGLPLPPIDLMTVYELSGAVRSSDNLAINTEKLVNYPNVRSVIGMYATYVQAAAMDATSISKFRVIANGNNVLRDATLLLQQIEQRMYLEGDILLGTYWQLHRTKPIETALFGNFQWGITPTVVGANPYLEQMTESFYTKGSALPGFNQG